MAAGETCRERDDAAEDLPMSDRLRGWLERMQRGVHALAAAVPLVGVRRARTRLAAAAVLALCAFVIYAHPPFASVPRGQILVRTNLLDGSAQAYTAGTVLMLPGIHQLRRFPTRDQVFRPLDAASATG